LLVVASGVTQAPNDKRELEPMLTKTNALPQELGKAETMLKELVLYVGPPCGCAIVLTEWKSSGPTDPNWVAASGNMAAQKLVRYTEKVAELRRTDPEIDWSDVKILVGPRRVALWLSEIDDS
jgi:hypothetical protein